MWLCTTVRRSPCGASSCHLATKPFQSEFTHSHGRDFVRDMGEWVASGKVRYREDVVDGLDNAPAAFTGMLRGENFGKLVVKVG